MVRLDGRQFGLDGPAVHFPQSDFLIDGDPETFGFRRLGQPTPPAAHLGVDLSSRFEVRVVIGDPGFTEPSYLLTVEEFVDPHPEQWWGEAHQMGRLLLLTSPHPWPVDLHAKRLPHLAIVPLIIFAYPGGIGSRPGG